MNPVRGAAATIVLASTIGLSGCATQPQSHRIVDADGVPSFLPCPTAPRCAVSQAGAGGDKVPALQSGGDATSAHVRLLAVLAADSRYRILSDDGRYVHAEFTTRRMRYRDDVEFLIRADGRIDVRSSGRIGWYDWETNSNRIEALRAALAAPSS